MRSRRGTLLLLLTSMIWGVAFVFQSTGGDITGPYTFSCTRFIIASIAMGPAVLFLDRRGLSAPPSSPAERRLLIRAGVLCGVFLAGTSITQQLGLYLGTAPGKAGFLTACYIVLVPVLGLFLRKRCGWNVWLAVGVTVAGLYLLCMKGSLTFQLSDVMILVCSLCCALHILVIDHYGDKVDAVRMSWIQFMVAAVIAAFPMVFLDIGGTAEGLKTWSAWLSSREAWTAVLYAGLLSSSVGYTLQCVGQQSVPPTLASLLMSLESVFSVLAGWLMLGQALSLRELTGCALIFAAVILAQLPVHTRSKEV